MARCSNNARVHSRKAEQSFLNIIAPTPGEVQGLEEVQGNIFIFKDIIVLKVFVSTFGNKISI